MSRIPTSVYRIQLCEQMNLKKVRDFVPYLYKLGIEGVYTSPFFEACSTHGYDVTNPNQINPKLGTLKDIYLLSEQLKKYKMSWIIDLVPNHMGIAQGKNMWWQDVLRLGPFSFFAPFFDIDWDVENRAHKGKVLLPILGVPYSEFLESSSLSLNYKKGIFSLNADDFSLPVAPHSYVFLIHCLKHKISKEIYEKFLQVFDVDYSDLSEDKKMYEHLHAQIGDLIPEFLKFAKSIEGRHKVLHPLLEMQFYRLAYWRAAGHELNYRRFFNIHELVAIRMEEPEVFKTHHQLVKKLVSQEIVQGVRIDHPDGLYDPVGYFNSLKKTLPVLTVVEKILERKERLPSSWNVEGTVGYEALNVIGGLFVQKKNEQAFTRLYQDFIEEFSNWENLLFESKKLFTNQYMASEVQQLGTFLSRLTDATLEYRDFTRLDLTRALETLIAVFPVYRTYISPKGGVSKRDARYLEVAVAKAKAKSPDLDESLFKFFRQLFLLELPRKLKEHFRPFILRFQQLTGPIMAKGLEDTTFYRYNRLLCLNEVGGDPMHFGTSSQDFHRFNQQKKESWPYGFLTSSTHDTKRSCDARMRLSVLSEIPKRWNLEVRKWHLATQKWRKEEGPSLNDTYMIYQTLLAGWPRGSYKISPYPQLLQRFWKIIIKSLREAKENTCWDTPNEVYESATYEFLSHLIANEESPRFLEHFLPFLEEIEPFATYHSLSFYALQMSSCGIVDLYQGNELWNYFLVDPDNRNPYDFSKGEKALIENKSCPDKFKVQWMQKALLFRKNHAQLFLEGDYFPLRIRGKYKEHLIGLGRKTEQEWFFCFATRFLTKLLQKGKLEWKNTEICFPKEVIGVTFLEVFSGKKKRVEAEVMTVSSILEKEHIGWLHAKR